MKKNILITLFIALISFSAEGKEQIRAKIKNLKDTNIKVKVYDAARKNVIFDTTISCKSGGFVFDKNFDDPVFVTFLPQSGLLDTKLIRGVVERNAMKIEVLTLPNQKYNISGSVDEYKISYNISGSTENEVLSAMRSKYIDAYRYYDMESEYFRDKRTKEERDSIYHIGKKIEDKLIKEKLDYIKNNLGSQLSGLFLSEQGYNDFIKYYNEVDKSVIEGIFKANIEKKRRTCELITNNKKMKVGSDMIDFTLTGINGETITLSDLKGEYVLLYFWGSWCHWCIAGAPNLNKLYDELNGKLKIVGIACNDKAPALAKAIKDNNIKWDNYMEADNISFRYGVTGYPAKIVINPEGKVVFIYEGEHENFYKEVVNYIK